MSKGVWQKCPNCEGSGVNLDAFSSLYAGTTNTHITCPTCGGERIISQVTGQPPKRKKAQKQIEK